MLQQSERAAVAVGVPLWHRYEDTNEAERLADDPTMRVVGAEAWTDRSTNTMRGSTEVLTGTWRGYD